MMKRCSTFATYFFLLVSMVMLSAAVVPHHHHWEEFCVSICDAEENEHHACQHESGAEDGEPEGNGCHDECITKFVCQQPPLSVLTVDVAPGQDFRNSIIDVLPSVQAVSAPWFSLEERLPSATARGSMALRAPPADC